VSYLANCLTGISLFCGSLSIIFSLEGHFTFAAWAIILSVIFDGLDGQVARRNSSSSEFGKELDSLVDVVSFGIAPAMLGYIFVYGQYRVSGALVLFIYLACSVFRLAKYNITTKEKTANYFMGLPTTVSGGVLASFILMFRKQDQGFCKFFASLTSAQCFPIIFLLIMLVLAFLMVSKIKYLNLDGLRLFMGEKTKFLVSIIILILAIAIIFNKAGIVLFLSFLIYLIFSPFVVKILDNHS